MSKQGGAEKNRGFVFRCCAGFQNEEGVALVTSLLVLVLLALLAPIIVRRTADDIGRTESFKESRTAFYIAEAGLEQAKASLKASNFDSALAGPDGNTATTTDNGTFTIAGGSIVTIGGSQYTQVSFNGGTYSVRFYDNNDGDGNLTKDVDGIGYINAIGSYKNSTKTIRAMVRKQNINPSNFPAAVTLVGPTAHIDGSGSGFTVSGNGTHTDGTADASCTSQHGVATEATAANTTTEWNGGAQNQIIGVGGTTPDISNSQTTFTYTKALAFYNSTQPLATNLGVTSMSGGTLGTSASPKINYASGNLRLTGNITGVGILIVDGDLDIQGTLNFQGVILVGVCSTCTGRLVGTGSADVYGAIVTGNAINAETDFTGHANIMYSCEGLNNAAGALSGTFAVVSWNEVT